MMETMTNTVTGDLVFGIVFLIGQFIGMVWAIWNWNNKEISSVNIVYAFLCGGVSAILLVGCTPVLLLGGINYVVETARKI